MKSPKYFKLPSKLRLPVTIRKVVGHSMVPGLPPGITVIAHRLVGQLKVGDIVIFDHEGKEKIKRIAEIKQDEVFVLGDHPETSTDSRQFGWISKNMITAKVFWPAPKQK